MVFDVGSSWDSASTLYASSLPAHGHAATLFHEVVIPPNGTQAVVDDQALFPCLSSLFFFRRSPAFESFGFAAEPETTEGSDRTKKKLG